MSLVGLRFAIRPDERRDTRAAVFMLFGVVGSISILETARDALFLAHLPATRLPFTYLATAVVSLIIVNAQSRWGVRTGRFLLAVWTLAAAAITFALGLLVDWLGTVGIYAVYIWSSVLGTLVLVQLWTFLSTLFTVTQAKRLYGPIGTGGVLGAIAGSAVARGLANVYPPQRLVFASALGFLITGAIPFFFARGTEPDVEEHGKNAMSIADTRLVARLPYARLVALSMLVATACVTVGDYVFKSAVAASIPKAQLGTWLATVYLALNISSLIAQLIVTGWITRRFTVTTAFSVLPVLLLGGGLGMVFASGLIAALVIKGADGTLRYSLHKTSSEMLFLAFPDSARQRLKGFIDVVGQRGGQAIASAAILLVVGSGHKRGLPVMLIVLAAAWLVLAKSLQRPYLDLFRSRLRSNHLEHLAFPKLDLASLETLIRALDSHADPEVLAALDVLEREGKARLIPGLILYHPAEAVVERALAIFTRAHRADVVQVLDRLIDHPSARIRAAVIAARSVLDPNAQPLLLRMSFEESPEVRATITVNLIASGEIYGEDAQGRLDGLIRSGSVQTRVALAEAIGRRGASGFSDVLVALAAAKEGAVRRAAAEAMATVHDTRFVPALIAMLPVEDTRAVARALLVTYGDEALPELIATLEDPERKSRLRWRVAQVLPLFNPTRAAAALLSLMRREQDGAIRFQIVRSLEALLRRHPDFELDPKPLAETIDHTLRRAYRYLSRRQKLVHGAHRDPRRNTLGHTLLAKTLLDKAHNAEDRLFRVLGLAHPLEDFVQIYRDIVGGRRDARAIALEVVGNVLVDPIRTAVIGLVDDIPDELRLEAAGPYGEPVPDDYEELLAELLASKSEPVRAVAIYHVGELGISELRGRIDGLSALESARGLGAGSDVERALQRLDDAAQAVT
ncbi:MAG TPA: HEAT repeat domain-containing protein [Polyangiaceae bacterium]|jgi:AAA family ATP:ADP antiporter|nr:HEAT repeat domain-containing protein [Polyangiaceae bacterium]